MSALNTSEMDRCFEAIFRDPFHLLSVSTSYLIDIPIQYEKNHKDLDKNE